MRLLPILISLGLSAGGAGSAYAVDPTGIPECDAFLDRYESCGLEILTGGAKLQFEKTILDSAMSTRASLNNPQARADMVRLCTDTFAALKTNDTPFKICMNR